MIKGIFLRASSKLWIVYSILVVEYTLYACMPWLLGKTIDSLLHGKYYYFLLYGVSGLLGLMIGVFRRRLDTRIFAGICLIMTKGFLKKTFELFNKSPSKILVRVKKIGMFTQFAEHTVPRVVKSTIYIIVSFFCLFSSLGAWTFVIFGLMSVTLATSYFFSTKIEKVIDSAQLTDEQKEKNIIEGNEEETYACCETSTNLDIKFSDLQAANWGIVDICCVVCELVAIYILTVSIKPSVGQIMASLSYVHSLCGYFQVFPSIIEELKHLKVASKYLQSDT
jgi:hypothetical protein